MKKLLLLTFVVICISIIIPYKIYAVDITAGATTWFAWYDLDAGIGNTTMEKMEADPTFMYGPALSVKFNDDFNLTFVWLYGKFDLGQESGGKDVKYKRRDSDLAFNYRLNDYFKVFGGVKYVRVWSNPLEFDWFGCGPGLGLSATIPITDNIFALATFSGFYLWSKDDREIKAATTEKIKYDYERYGFNSTLAIA
jgi:hypothetical protein